MAPTSLRKHISATIPNAGGIEEKHSGMTALSSDSNRTEMAKLKPSAVAGDSSARHKVSTMVEQKESIVALGSIGGAVDDQKDQIIRMLRGRVDELEEKLKRVLPNVCSRCAVDAVDDLELAPISEAKLAALQQQATLKAPAFCGQISVVLIGFPQSVAYIWLQRPSDYYNLFMRLKK